MSKRAKIIAISVGLVVVVALFSVKPIIKALRYAVPVTVDGVITHVDVEKRKASAEFEGPWDGELKNRTANVPPDCEITLNGKAVPLEAIRAGDQAQIRGKMIRDTKEIELFWVHATRAEPTPAPASTPAN